MVISLALLTLYIIFIYISYRGKGTLSAYYGSVGVLAGLASIVNLVLAAGSMREEDSFRLFPRLGLFLSVLDVACWAGTYAVGVRMSG